MDTLGVLAGVVVLRASGEFTAEAHLLGCAPTAERGTTLDPLRIKHHIDYPFILKPDVGQRGVGVKLIRTPEQAKEYLRANRAPIVIQRCAPGPLEAGVFYYRFPQEDGGRIFSITEIPGAPCCTPAVHSLTLPLER